MRVMSVLLLRFSSAFLGQLLIRALLPADGHSKRNFACLSQLRDSRSYGLEQNEMLHSH